MAGYLVTISDAEFQRKLAALRSGLADASPLMRIWGEIAHASIQKNIEVGGRPPWQPLAAATVKIKGHARPLIGRTGNLQNITVLPGAQSVKIGSNPAAKAYAAIQQFGGQAGRGHKVTIPARPYIMLQKEDEEEMAQEARKYIEGLAS